MSLFSKEMTEYIAETIRDNYDAFFPSSKESSYAKRANDAWEGLANDVNANFSSSLTVKQIKEKWHNMKQTAKRRFAGEKKDKNETGGGPFKGGAMDPTYEAIADTFGETAAFKGIPGAKSTPIYQEVDTEVQQITGRKLLPLGNIANAILSSAVLHNLAIDMKLPLLGDDFDDEQPFQDDFEEVENLPQWRSERQQRQAAVAKRDELTARFN